MKLSKYRIGSGHYRVGEWNIYGGSRIRWQVRDEHDQLVEDFDTLREAIRYAQGQAAAVRAKDVRPATLPIELAQMLGI